MVPISSSLVPAVRPPPPAPPPSGQTLEFGKALVTTHSTQHVARGLGLRGTWTRKLGADIDGEAAGDRSGESVSMPPDAKGSPADDSSKHAMQQPEPSSWRVSGPSPPPVRAPPPSGKLSDLGKALVVADSMHVARRLATINVSPGAGTLQTALDAASAGDTLVLADGTYTGSGSDVLTIAKGITIRAQNAGQAILDGETARRVIKITSGTVVLEGLKITRGSVGNVSARLLPFPGPFIHRPHEMFAHNFCMHLLSQWQGGVSACLECPCPISSPLWKTFP